MSKSYDAIIIGAGIIGNCISFELGKKGYKTLNIDKLGEAGFGSTANSCAIVRAHYSTWDGVAMAYEGFSYWKNWDKYLGIEDERGNAKYMNCGTIGIKSADAHWKKYLPLFREIGVEHEDWDLETFKKKAPYCDIHAFYPTKRPEDDAFWEKPENMIDGAVYTPGSGYVSDPILASHNAQRASENVGGTYLLNTVVTDILKENNRVKGVQINGNEEIYAPIVINVAGPHSFVINRMADVEDQMNIKTRALRHEVCHVPSPEGFDFEKDGLHISDGDNSIYIRPETGNHILIGSEDPECDPQEWISDPDNYNNEITEAQWKAQVYRLSKRLPTLGIPSKMKGVVDLYDVSDDWIPLYDRSVLDGFYMAIGSSGNQFKNAPVAGYVMAELIEKCEAGHDHDNDPVQVKTEYTGLELNMGFYSRNRKINPNSSFSVNG